MKIISKHPEIYLRYRDKRILSYGLAGKIVGYATNNKTRSILLIMETEEISNINSISDIALSCNVTINEYYGNIKKDFFFISKDDLMNDKKTFII